MPRSDFPKLGASCLHRSVAAGQRGWKRQPEGGAAGDGTSPAMSCADPRPDGSGSGIESISALV